MHLNPCTSFLCNVNVFPQKQPAKINQVDFFWIFLYQPEVSTLWKLVFNCLSRNTFPNDVHHVPKGKSSRHFSELLVPFLKGIKEQKRMEYKEYKITYTKQFVSKRDITVHAMRFLLVAFFRLPYFPNLKSVSSWEQVLSAR